MRGIRASFKIGLLKFLRESVGSQFVIPVFRRNYTWMYNRKVIQHFQDLENVIAGKFDQHFKERAYFKLVPFYVVLSSNPVLKTISLTFYSKI